MDWELREVLNVAGGWGRGVSDQADREVCSRLNFKGSMKFCQLDKCISGRSSWMTVRQSESMVCPETC